MQNLHILLLIAQCQLLNHFKQNMHYNKIANKRCLKLTSELLSYISAYNFLTMLSCVSSLHQKINDDRDNKARKISA
jgi:hypothetical protein